ncbi:hypothetical protein [Mammaliicoccus sciuri]|uniref:hypothetical protein n=1 Tax=Mammaliicoccus sciuri TaxID=1296 RepID=UPI001FB498E2|nr:hypothetical protein [Mammaliicoccus sciuri]MCJ1785221.1 hypothetical protein [Mammaliicoccus sciuri]
MKNIINLRDQLENAINEEVEFQFKKALRECETLGELRIFELEEIKAPAFSSVTEVINSEIKRRFRKRVDNYIENTSIHK